MPVGTVIIWPSWNMPTQGVWLECNGQSTSGYPALAAVIGANVPDYRGVFLRGYGSQTSYHYGAITHWSDGLGVLQGDAIRNITGTFGGHLIGFTSAAQTTGAFSSSVVNDRAAEGGGDYTRPNFTFNAALVVPTANENRPVNKAVRYLIKAQ